jgi:hypothetical protein
MSPHCGRKGDALAFGAGGARTFPESYDKPPKRIPVSVWPSYPPRFRRWLKSIVVYRLGRCLRAYHIHT